MKNEASTVEDRVIAKIRERREAGLKKYGTSMERTDLSRLDWLIHAQQEMMDGAIYLEKLIGENEAAAADTLRHAAREALVALAVLKVTDDNEPYSEIGPVLREQIRNSHDLLMQALKQMASVPVAGTN